MKEIILQELNKYSKAFSTQTDSVYIYKNIPKKKEFNAKKTHSMSLKEEILWLSDITMWGSANDNCIITERGFFFHETTFGEVSYLSVLWDKLLRVEYVEGNESFLFIFSEDDDNQNKFLLKTNLVLNIQNDCILDFVNFFNFIASQTEDYESILLDQLFLEEEEGNIDKIHSISGQFLDEYNNSPNAFHALRAKGIAYFNSQDYEKALNFIDLALNYFSEDRDMSNNMDNYFTLNECKAIIQKNNNNYYSSLGTLLNNYNSLNKFMAKQEYFPKVSESYELLKENYKDYPFEERKFLLIENELTELEDSNVSILLKNNMPALKFPVSHPQEKNLYILHPYKKDLYFPVSTFENVLFRERVDELFNLLRCLGAIKITVEFKKGKTIESINSIKDEKEVDLSVGIKKISNSIGLSKNSIESTTSQNHKSDNVNITQTFPFPENAPYIPDSLVWYEHELSWQNIYRQRVEGGMLNHNEVISTRQITDLYSSNYDEISAELSYLISKGRLNSKCSTEFKSKIEEETVWNILVEFAPLTNQKISGISSVEEYNTIELEYMEEIEFLMEEGSEFTSKEWRFLNRLRDKLGISESRALILEDQILKKNFLSDNEKEYLTEFKFFLEEGEITAKERRMLNKFASTLGIDLQRIESIEKSLVSN